MTAPDPFPDTLEQLFGPAPAAAPAAPVEPPSAADPPAAAGAAGPALGG
ncbi:hypothetical protein [Streptomyces sp. NP160]|nr:hypothetical protein [Streptomyces sp. NP160]